MPRKAVNLDAAEPDSNLPDISLLIHGRNDRAEIERLTASYAEAAEAIKGWEEVKKECGGSLKEALESNEIEKMRVLRYRVQRVTVTRTGGLDVNMLLEAGVPADTLERCKKPDTSSSYVKVTALDKE